MIALANGIVRQLGELGWDHQLAQTCHEQIETIRQLDAAHLALGPLCDSYAAAKRKYGIGA